MCRIVAQCASLWYTDFMRSEHINIRLSLEELAAIEACAASEHMSASAWARRVLLLAMGEVVQAGHAHEEKMPTVRNNGKWVCKCRQSNFGPVCKCGEHRPS